MRMVLPARMREGQRFEQVVVLRPDAFVGSAMRAALAALDDDVLRAARPGR